MSAQATSDARFTVAGAYSGHVYAAWATTEIAADWARGYVQIGFDLAELFASLETGGVWRSHPDAAAGLIVRRIA